MAHRELVEKLLRAARLPHHQLEKWHITRYLFSREGYLFFRHSRRVGVEPEAVAQLLERPLLWLVCTRNLRQVDSLEPLVHDEDTGSEDLHMAGLHSGVVSGSWRKKHLFSCASHLLGSG